MFWIRADRPENFLADYYEVLKLISKGPEFGELPSNDPNLILAMTRDRLEACSFKWLLVLDNADNIESFRSMNGIRLQDFLPRRGWILITTRESRLVGQVSSAKDEMKVQPMLKREAKALLLESVPADLAVKGYKPKNESEDQALDFVEELGLLPLAIAQAAANIRHLRTPLSSYIALYDQRKSREKLLKQGVEDPRMPPQSILLTWQISFDHIEKSNPVAAKLLCYMAFFHWQSVPMTLLKVCPQFIQLSEIEYLEAAGELLNLSLLEGTDTEGYSIHPMVHYWLSIRLKAEERTGYLMGVVDIMARLFPEGSYEKDPLCRYLLPHALNIVEQATEMNMEEKPLTHLIQRVACFLLWAGINSLSVVLSRRALEMGEKLYSAEDMDLIYLRRYKGLCLGNAGRYEEAVIEFRKCLQDLATAAGASDLEKASGRSYIRANLVESLSWMGEPGINEAAEILEADLDEVRRRTSDQILIDAVTTHRTIDRLIKLQRFEKAIPFLKWIEHEGKSFGSDEVVILLWYETYGDFLRGKGREEGALKVYAKGLEQIRKRHSSQDDELWVALHNVSLSLYNLRRFGELRQLVSRWVESVPERSVEGSRLVSAIKLYNMVAMSYHRQWRLEEAELLHRDVLEQDTCDPHGILDIKTQIGSPRFHIYVYNLCLCLARQDKWQQVRELKVTYASQLEHAESIQGEILETLIQDTADVAIYEEAQRKVATGITITEDPWYVENRKALERGKDRFGSLHNIEGPEPNFFYIRKNHLDQWKSLRELFLWTKKDDESPD